MGLLLAVEVFSLLASPETVLRAEAFALRDVRLLDGPFKEAMERNAAWLLALEPDRLLAGAREDAGLAPRAPRYGGWEQQGVASHTLGHYLSACALQFAASGDARFEERVRHIVSEMALCQAANGNGYVAAIPDGKRVFAEIARGDIRAENFQLNGVWVPWYTMHKLLAGLRDAYLHAGIEAALPVYIKLADWASEVTSGLNTEQLQDMLRCEHGGMNEVAADLHAITGDAKYLALARRFNHAVVMTPAARGEDQLNGLHANTQFPKFIGFARQYELSGDQSCHDAAAFFWERVVHHHSYVTGGNSNHEHFGPPDALNDRLSPETTESCNTYNMLKLTRHLFQWDAAPARADFYERALFNHILGSQNPDTGEVTYFVPLESGRMKTYQTLFDTFSCCVGTGMENHTRYGEAIYFHDAAELYVNLFIASELNWREKGLTLRQETRFPDEDTTQLRLTCQAPLALRIALRYPAWTQDGVTVQINGEPVPVTAAPGEYIVLQRTWQDGDIIAARFPMRAHAEAMPDNPRRVALRYGPVVLAGALGEAERAPDQMPVLITRDEPVTAWLKPVAGETLRFMTNGIGHPEDLRLMPFFRMHHQRHIVYWDLFTPEQWEARQAAYREEQARRQALEARTLDYVQPGEMQPERDHAFDGENTRHGMHLDRKWRDAADGGCFAFTMKVSPDGPAELICTYWGSDAGKRVFDVLVDGKRLATQSLETPHHPNQFFDVVYPIPPEYTQGKERVRVTFQAHPGMMAGGVFGCRMAVPE